MILDQITSRSIQVSSNLYLVNYCAELKEISPVKERVNHIWIYDRSGSMCGLLPNLIEDLIVRSKKIPQGDTLTLGWFSGEGQYNFIIKGFKITDDADFEMLEHVLRKNNTTLSTTCFSEILEANNQNLIDLSFFSTKFSVCLFTDGYPVVSHYKKEVDRIFAAIENSAGKVTSALLVGYGDYYNKTLMSQMAEKFGGSLIHASDLSSFSVALDAFVNAAETARRIPIQIDEKITDDAVVFSLAGANVNIYSLTEYNQVLVSSQESKVDVFLLTSAKPNAKVADLDENLTKAAYAAAYLLSQKTKTDVAIDVLGFLGDKRLIDGATNAYTNAEYGRLEKALQDAIIDPQSRFLDGKVENYVPPADAFCLLDLIDALSHDDEAYFYPRHNDFKYKRIGAASKVVGEFTEFVADPATRSSFRDVVWNETKINLSLRSLIQGTVDLGSEAKKYGLSQIFPTFQYRNYTFVKDGVLNVAKLPASFSEKTFSLLIKTGVVELENPIDRLLWEQDKVYILNLDKIPIVNRKIVENKTSAVDLCKKVLLEQQYKATIKTLKWYKAKFFPEKEVTADTAKTFIEKQQAFLESKGINTKTGAFEPKTETIESTDFYMAKEFEIKVKGLSSLPKVENVLEKLKSGKKLTTSEKLVTAGVNIVESRGTMMDSEFSAWLDSTLADYQKLLKDVRRSIQEVKFAILLAKKWFVEFSSREENKLTLDDYEFTISLREVKVGY